MQGLGHPFSSVLLKLSLNAIDLFFAFFLVLGGLNLIGNHAIAGAICVVMAPVLIVLSVGVWSGDRQKLIVRAVLYWAAFIIFGGSAGVVAVTGGLHNTHDNSIVFGVTMLLLVAAVLSTIQLRQG